MPQVRHGVRSECSACHASVRGRKRGHGRQRQGKATTGVERQGCGSKAASPDRYSSARVGCTGTGTGYTDTVTPTGTTHRGPEASDRSSQQWSEIR
eukprot:1861217-Amphidinium_carterae.1